MAAEGVRGCKRQTGKLINTWISVPGTYFVDDKTNFVES